MLRPCDFPFQVAVRDASRHAEVEEKLEQLRALSTDLPGSGWVQPQDSRVPRQCWPSRATARMTSWKQAEQGPSLNWGLG